MAFIYKITNDINNKIYIGKTELSKPENRWKEHLQDYKRRRCEKRPLYDAMNKYGTKHFHFEVIEETDSPEEREKFWIKKLRTYVGFDDCKGYNATLGGDGKSYLNLNENEVVKYHTEEACYVIGETANYFHVDRVTIKRILSKNNIPWLKSKDAVRLKVYEKHGGVYQVSKKTRLILNIFENIKNANIFMGKKEDSTAISNACEGFNKNHSAYGYLWYYGDDLRKRIDNGEIVTTENYCDQYDLSIYD